MSNTLNWKNMLKSLIIVTFIWCSLILFIKKFFTIDNKKYTYNMNVSESINLDKVYKNDKFTKGNNVTWNTNDKNIIIENSIVTAKNPGKAKITATNKNNNKIESDGDWTWGKGHHKTTCYNFVNEVLIKTGYLRKKWLCHTGSTTKPTGLNLLYKNKVNIYHNKSIKNLKPGYVVVWSKSGSEEGNIAIFAHKKENKYYFYGASYSKEVKDKHHPSSRMSDYWKEKSGKLTIIRASE